MGQFDSVPFDRQSFMINKKEREHYENILWKKFWRQKYEIFCVCTAFCRGNRPFFWLWHRFVCLVSIILLFRGAYFCKHLYILHMTKTTAASNTTHVFNVHHLCNERQLFHRSPFLRYNARWIYWIAFSYFVRVEMRACTIQT